MHPKYKTQYRVGNWPAYDRALVQRGDVTFWLAPEAIARWEAAGPRPYGSPYSPSSLRSAGAVMNGSYLSVHTQKVTCSKWWCR